MSSQCDCGDSECAICGARPSSGRKAFVDPYLEAKAKAAQKPVAPAVPTVQVPTPVVAQLAASWTPPPEAQAETERLMALPVEQFQAPAPPVDGAPAEPKKQTPYAAAYSAWQADCVKRKEWINRLRSEWKQSIVERETAFAQWHAHVAAKRRVYESAAQTEPPPAPRKEQYPST